jgi:hypothetical protein
VGKKGRGWGKGGEMTQTLYAHINKEKKKKWISKTWEGYKGYRSEKRTGTTQR